ncbi:protein disulfide isomerase isoform X1 [Calliopsis andreniformis]|uniref:protein disulfide isomerase isoform X1 n=1 Tax=Calliopsis andreniformis TaxID=337506 RepID=UPI003FCEC2CE
MEQKFDPSILNKFLYQTLIFTEEVKNVLKLNCDEVMFSLKPWRMEMVIKQELSETCTCPKSETGVEEIAAGISKALLQTQQLREKLSLSTMTRKNSAKQLSVAEIYNPLAADGKKREKERNFNPDNKNLHGIKNKSINKFSTQNKSSGNDLQTKVIEENTNSGGTKSKELAVHSGKSIKNKNFLAINKQNIKNTKEIRKQKSSNHKLENNSKSSSSITKTKCIKFDKRSSMASTSELKDLIQKMSNESNDCVFLNTYNTNCPLHGNVTSQFTYEQNFVTMDVVDSLIAFNIPGQVIKPLKAYHTYLNNEFSDKSIDNGKQKKMFNKFLTEFNKMNEAVYNSLIQKNHNTSTLNKLILLLKNVFSKDIEASVLANNKQMFAEINSVENMYDVKQLDSLHIWKSNTQKTLVDNNYYTTGWMSNGVWNPSYTQNFKGLSRVKCMYYGNDSQLLLFFEVMQQLQQLQYSKELIQIILQNVLPNMKLHFDPTKPEFVKMYKAIYILCQGLNPKIPILVRTDK